MEPFLDQFLEAGKTVLAKDTWKTIEKQLWMEPRKVQGGQETEITDVTEEDQPLDAPKELAVGDEDVDEIAPAEDGKDQLKEEQLRKELEQLQDMAINPATILKMKYTSLASVLGEFTRNS